MPSTIPTHLEQSFFSNLENLKEAGALVRQEQVKKLLSSIDIIAAKKDGIRYLYDHIGAVTEAGFFNDSLWEDPMMLNPALVGGTLKVGGGTTLFEVMSELRMLAIANGAYTTDLITPKRARAFLDDVIINNLDIFFPDASEELRNVESSTRKLIRGLFDLVGEFLSLEAISEKLATEIELICLQRPIVTDRALSIIKTVYNRQKKNPDLQLDERLQKIVDSIYAPSPYTKGKSAYEYRTFLNKAHDETIKMECDYLGETLRNNGLSTMYHAVLLRHVRQSPKLVKELLGLDNYGKAEYDTHKEFVTELIEFAVHPETSRSVYGLATMLERNLISRQPVKSGLGRFIQLNIHPEVEESIREGVGKSSLQPAQHLMADVICILGQPLGIGQGWNPTCQSARGISLWSRHAPGKLLDMILTAALYNNLEMRFEGQLLSSSQLGKGLTKEFDYNLDVVSIVLVPHLDRIYNEMMKRASIRGEDPHKWVNPAMYGHWIPTGFITPYDYLTNSIKEYDHFLRVFYATHHPDYNGGHDLAYPNPVGIFLTASNGKLLGFHAVSILRIAKNKGATRIYFLNPNNEGRQKWQSDIKPTVAGNGERPGESSLPFHQFASRLYAFHYVTSDAEETDHIPQEEIEKVTQISRESWGTSYTWLDKSLMVM